ncbi:hypothetical protein D3C87_1565220 [compost metagenome]
MLPATYMRPEASKIRCPSLLVTVKGGLVPAKEPTCTLIKPLVAPTGTCTISCVPVPLSTVAGTPLNLTTFAAGGEAKLRPCSVTVAPIGAVAGSSRLIWKPLMAS